MLIIIGTGLAGYNTAKEFRKLDTDTPMTLITLDDGAFYSKPQLSTGFTRNKTAAELRVFSVEKMREQLNATILVNTKVTAIDSDKKTVTINDDQDISYEQLVLAAGADVLHAPLAGDAVSDVLSINNLVQYARFRERMQGVKHVVIMGTGLVGCEYSNDLINGGFDVTLIAPDPWPLKRLLPEALGRAMRTEFEKKGICFFMEKFATEINHNKNGGYDLTLCNQQEVLHADLVLSAIGFRASETLARMAGVNCDKGVQVDTQFRTSNASIFAIGDCAVMDDIWRPYVAPILHGSKLLAKVLTGDDARMNYPVMPVITKTPFCAMVTVPPLDMNTAEWIIEGEVPNLQALVFNAEDSLVGFALLAKATVMRADMTKKLSK